MDAVFCLSLCLLASLGDLAAQTPKGHARTPKDEADLRFWLENMTWHQFTTEEMAAATGMAISEVLAAGEKLNIQRKNKPKRGIDSPLLVLPYPGGRHPRLGFLDGAVDPQRETKLSVFTPWDEADYVVLDLPEAIWSNLGLSYLAHSHVPTIWTKQGNTLPIKEWTRHPEGGFSSRRVLPNGIAFHARATP